MDIIERLMGTAERLYEAPVALLVLGAACVPMLAVHGFSVHGLVLTTTMRSLMRRGFPLAAVAASSALFLGKHGVYYAGTIIVPFLQWHVVRLMYDWYVGRNGRPPRAWARRSLEGGGTADEFAFEVVSGLGVLALPATLMVFTLFVQRAVL